MKCEVDAVREETTTPRAASGHPDAGHPDVERWIAYHGGELAAPEEEPLRRHLAACPACVSLVLELEDFASAEGGEDRAAVSEFERAAAWKAMKAALARETAPPKRWLERRVPVPMALAASLVVAALGLSLWGIEHRRVERYSRPQVDLAIRDLEPSRATRSGGAESPTELSRGSYSALVMLPSRSFASYRMEILDARGRTVWSASGLTAHPQLGTLSVGLPPGFLEPGDYRVELYGGEGNVPLEDDLPIRVVP